MPNPHQPPFTLTAKIVRLIAEISEQLGRLSVLEDEKALRLRRINRIRTIQGSLANVDNTSPQVSPQVTPQVNKLLSLLHKEKRGMKRDELQQSLQLKDRKSFRERYLKPALQAGLIEMTVPDKPSSRLQQYRLTEAGSKEINR